jgi:hypothetical protein
MDRGKSRPGVGYPLRLLNQTLTAIMQILGSRHLDGYAELAAAVYRYLPVVPELCRAAG